MMALLVCLCAAIASAATTEQHPYAFDVKVTGKGKAMILVPGLSSSGEVWDSTVAHYRDRFECHVLTVAGFAGVPRVPAPMLARVEDDIAAYIRGKKLDHPILIGHSLGGFLTLSVASKYPDLIGRAVIVDAYPFFAALMNPNATEADGKKYGDGMRQRFGAMTQEQYVAMTKSGASVKTLVTGDADLQRIIDWGVKSDRTAVADAMGEMIGTDLRDEISTIKVPVMVLGSWVAYKGMRTHEDIDNSLHQQYAKLRGVDIRVTDTARHFIMYDDPAWFFQQVDSFVTPKGATK